MMGAGVGVGSCTGCTVYGGGAEYLGSHPGTGAGCITDMSIIAVSLEIEYFSRVNVH
jgi:hypothetical protein